MTILEYPFSFEPDQAEWALVTNSQTFRSPLSGAIQTVSLPGAFWTLKISLQFMEPDEIADFFAFLAELDGQAGRFHFGPRWLSKRGLVVPSPNVTIDGVDQEGIDLNVNTGDLNKINAFRKGDYIHYDSPFGRELKIITQDADTDGTGKATLRIRPLIRKSPADTAIVEIDSPLAVMKLMDDRQASMLMNSPVIGSGTYMFEEAFSDA